MAGKVVIEKRVGKSENSHLSPRLFSNDSSSDSSSSDDDSSSIVEESRQMYLEFIKDGLVDQCFYTTHNDTFYFPNVEEYDKVNIYIYGALPNITYERRPGRLHLSINQSGYQFVQSVSLKDVLLFEIDTNLWLNKHINVWEGHFIIPEGQYRQIGSLVSAGLYGQVTKRRRRGGESPKE